MFYLTSRDTKTVRRTSWDLILLIGISTNFWDKSVHTLMNLENMQKSCFIWRHVTQKRYVVHHGDLILRSGTIWSQPDFDQEQFETNQKSMRLPVQKLWLKLWFSWFWRLWSWHLIYVLFFGIRTRHDVRASPCEVS